VIALCHASGHLEVDALLVEGLARDQFGDDRAPLGLRMRIDQTDAVEAALEAREVLRQSERLAMIDRDDLVDTVAVDEAAVEHGHLGVLER